MSHYICPECGGVSETHGVCQTDGCSMHGQPLQECNCDDASSQHKLKDITPESAPMTSDGDVKELATEESTGSEDLSAEESVDNIGDKN
ncbi:MAG: hypothetical protein ABH887_00480 [bacterium]